VASRKKLSEDLSDCSANCCVTPSFTDGGTDFVDGWKVAPNFKKGGRDGKKKKKLIPKESQELFN
jgi:hypothetical protein